MSAKLLVNGTGAIAAAIIGGWMVMSHLESDAAMVCEGRYPSSTRFSLTDETGASLSASGLQGRVGAGEWGVLENSAVVDGGSGAPSAQVLEVSIAEGTSSGHQGSRSRGGAGFTWTPFEMKAAAPDAACLSYQVFFPDNFDFGTGGVLPGLFLGSDFDPRGEPVIGTGAAAAIGWGRNGAVAAHLQYAGNSGWQNPSVLTTKVDWPRGKWVAIEQEVILNEPGKKNGTVRLWVDGALAGENTKIGLRGDPNLTMAGVLSEVHYGNVASSASAPKATSIQMTPFVIRWK